MVRANLRIGSDTHHGAACIKLFNKILFTNPSNKNPFVNSSNHIPFANEKATSCCYWSLYFNRLLLFGFPIQYSNKTPFATSHGMCCFYWRRRWNSLCNVSFVNLSKIIADANSNAKRCFCCNPPCKCNSQAEGALATECSLQLC